MHFAKKSKSKKNIAILLVVAMLLTIMPVAVFAAGEEGGSESTTEATPNSVYTMDELNVEGFSVEAGMLFNVVATVTTDSAVKVQWKIDEAVEDAVSFEVDTETVTREGISFDVAGSHIITATFLDANGVPVVDENGDSCAVSATFTVTAKTEPTKVIAVDAEAEMVEGETYATIQDAINYIAEQKDPTGWTINVAAGTYPRFTVLGGLDGLTVQAAKDAEVVIETVNNSAPSVPVSGGAPDTAGISVRNVDNVTLNSLTINVGTQTTPWIAAAVSTYTESTEKGDNLNIVDCTFNGSGSGIGVFINSGTTTFNVIGCEFSNLKEAIGMYGDGTLMAGAEVTGNIFENCSFAIHGYYGGTGEAGTLAFADNTVTGDGVYTKIVIQDQLNTGALRVNVTGNTLTNAIVGLVNLREDGETISPVLESNTFVENSFYVEALEPGNIHFYASYKAPSDENGEWVLTGKEDFDVDWGKNPDGSTAYITELIEAANAAGSNELNITGIDPDNLIKTFTWFKDGIYWETGETTTEPENPPVKEWETSKSKTATNLDKNFQSEVMLSLPSAEDPLTTDVVFVLDKSTSPTLEDQALNMLQDLKKQIEKDNAKVNVGVVIFNKKANVTDFKDLTTEYDAIEAAIKQDISSGTNTHAGLMAGKALLDADKTVTADRKYLIFVSDGISYMYNANPTATAWTWYGDSILNWAGPENWCTKYGTNNAPEDWDKWMATIGKEVDAQGTKYEYQYGTNPGLSTPLSGKDNFANSVDKALYLTCQEYRSAEAAGYHCYTVDAMKTNGTEYLWGASFMKYLADGEMVDFTTIQNDIYYLLDAGSTVDDYIGYVEDDYNFDFINNASAMTLKVGDNEYKAEKISENKYGFAPNDGGYDYVVEYFAGNKTTTEHFVWTINVPVSKFAPVQLTYMVQLMNPKSAEGTYGSYDKDGSKNNGGPNYGLYTNNSATLYPVDSNGDKGDPEPFQKPTVSYKVDEDGPDPWTPTEPPTKPDPEEPPVDIPDPDVPLVEPEEPTTEIDEPDVPLVEPGTPVEELDEPEVPLGDAPKTGDNANVIPFMVLLVLAGAGLVVVRRKFN